MFSDNIWNNNNTKANAQQDTLQYYKKFELLKRQFHQKEEKKNNSKIKIKRQFPPGISIPSVSANTTDLTFNNLGHVSNGKTITIQSEHFKKNIVFSIGTGGIDIREAN